MGYTSSQAKSFIRMIAPLIRTEATKRGYKVCSTAIAQAVVEGAAGTSLLASKYHNHFGMKCGKSWKGASVNMKTKEEYTVGTLTTIKDNFRAYDSDQAGVAGYYDFISTSRYANLKDAADYVQYAQMLKADGYATSSSYVSTLCNTVARYDLAVWDEVTSYATDVSAFPTLRKGDRGDYVRVLQQALNYRGIRGSKLVDDGIFGTNTLNCVIEFQALNELTKDGIVGQKTWRKLML